jgi:hypothetical protein
MALSVKGVRPGGTTSAHGCAANTRAKLERAMTRGIDWPADAGATREPTRPHPAAGRH